MPSEHAAVRVLVVEDEESYRQALESGLRREGFEVVLAADGPEGLRRFEESRPDIVLLDMLLPGMHGIDVCRRMLAARQVPVLMVSAVDTELDVVLGLELGAAGYVTKPFRLRELVARMHAILRRLPPSTDGSERDAPPASGHRDDRFGAVRVDHVRREVTASRQSAVPRSRPRAAAASPATTLRPRLATAGPTRPRSARVTVSKVKVEKVV